MLETTRARARGRLTTTATNSCTVGCERQDGKRPHRERERLVQEKLRIENRIEALLFTQRIRARPSLRSWERELTELRTGDGRTLPPLLRAELDRLRRRLVLILELIRELEAERAAALAAAPDEPRYSFFHLSSYPSAPVAGV